MRFDTPFAEGGSPDELPKTKVRMCAYANAKDGDCCHGFLICLKGGVLGSNDSCAAHPRKRKQSGIRFHMISALFNGILNHFHQLEHSLLACHTVRGAFEALMPRADKVTASSALWWEE